MGTPGWRKGLASVCSSASNLFHPGGDISFLLFPFCSGPSIFPSIFARGLAMLGRFLDPQLLVGACNSPTLLPGSQRASWALCQAPVPCMGVSEGPRLNLAPTSPATRPVTMGLCFRMPANRGGQDTPTWDITKRNSPFVGISWDSPRILVWPC